MLKALPATTGAAVDVSAALTRAGLQPACCCSTSAADPATCGEAIELPVIEVYGVLPDPVPAARAAVIPMPGAMISGLR